MSSEILTVTFSNQSVLDNSLQEIYECRNKPFIDGQVYFATIQAAEKLTHGEDVKTVYKLSLSGAITNKSFLPGDTIGVLPRNNNDAINTLLGLLNVESFADRVCKIEISALSKKKSLKLPPEAPLRSLFMHYVDINTPPKKLFLKALARHTSNPLEMEKLQGLCTPQASQDYIKFISGQGATLLGLLDAFPSCQPPIGVLLEHLPSLQPRFYSISSSPLTHGLEITFFVMEINGRKGLCTGWLQHLIEKREIERVPIYFRQRGSFSIPVACGVPLIFVATGTGIAPFRGFLQHKYLQGTTSVNYEIWLFYGCRYSDRDCLYKNEIDDYLKTGVLSRVDYAFSREGSQKKYVQDRIEEFGRDFVQWLLEKGARIFVCGDFKTVVKGVRGVVLKNLVDFGGMSEVDAESYLKEMQKEGRFVVDMWG